MANPSKFGHVKHGLAIPLFHCCLFTSEPSCVESDEDCEEEPASFTLTFNVSFPHDRDTVYLTHCYPYTFSLLQHHLLAIQVPTYLLFEDRGITAGWKLRIILYMYLWNAEIFWSVLFRSMKCTPMSLRQNDPNKSGLCRQRVLCRSLAGNPVYLLTITSNLPEDEGKVRPHFAAMNVLLDYKILLLNTI